MTASGRRKVKGIPIFDIMIDMFHPWPFESEVGGILPD